MSRYIYLLAISALLFSGRSVGQPLPCTPPLSCTLAWDGTPQPHLVHGTSDFNGHGLPPKVLSLTYDDGPSRPSPATTLNLASYLHDQGIRATFFVVTGRHTGMGLPIPDPGGCLCLPGQPAPWWNLADVPDLSVLASVKSLGHRIANHTNNHWPLYAIQDWFSSPSDADTATRNAVCAAQVIVDQYVDDGVYLLRPPYANWDEQPNHRPVSDILRGDQRLNKLVGPVLWTYQVQGTGSNGAFGDDWNCARLGYSAKQCADTLLSQIDAAGASAHGTILLHDWIWSNSPICSPPGAPHFDGTFALDLTQYLVPKLKERGFLLLPLEADPAFPGGMLFGGAHLWTSNYSDAEGWNTNIGYYGTFRAGDINGDHKTDICARGISGVMCSLSNGNGFEAATPWQWQYPWSNAEGWLPAAYSNTIQLGDVNGDGKDDICALAAVGIICQMSTGTAFGPPQLWLPMASLPQEMQSDVGYYGTLRLAKVRTDSGSSRKDLCFRAAAGAMCALNTGSAFASPSLWSAAFGDAAGWLPPFYSTTLKIADIDGDGRADACARGAAGLYCGLSTGNGFDLVQVRSAGTNFSNSDGFHLASGYYETFQLADVDSDGRADACIRSSAGFLCAKSLGSGFDSYRVWQKKDFRDDGGWLGDPYSATVMLGDFNGDGRADVCARSVDGIVCSLAGGSPN